MLALPFARRAAVFGLAGLIVAFAGCAKPEAPPVAVAEPAKDSAADPEPDVKLDSASATDLRTGVPQSFNQQSVDKSAESTAFFAAVAKQTALGSKLADNEVRQAQGLPKKFRAQDLKIAKLEALINPPGVIPVGPGPQPGVPVQNPPESTAESYNRIVDNPFKLVTRDPLSTVSAAVDTASYSNVRRFLNEGQLPPKDAVRIEDFVNYFAYDYPAPKGDHPVAFAPELAPCPWNAKHMLFRVGIQARKLDPSQMPMRNFVFLIDVSGSMDSPERLPLVKQSLKLLVDQLGPGDRVSIVTYAGDTSLRLPTTPGNQKEKILGVIESLNAGGSTAGASGIEMAYEQAEKSFRTDGINRVILATDGDFNVGISDDAELVRMIEQKRKTGVFLTILGYGMGNLKDAKMEQLAHHGNGHYAYIDSLDEAKKLFVEQGGALVTVAKDVKIQVEFNPKRVAGYRLIGYENRVLAAEDFKDDTKDAGDMGSGHTVTAIYELVPAGENVEIPGVDKLKYQQEPKFAPAADSDEWLTVKMRYKDPDAETSKELSAVVSGPPSKEMSADFRFAASVAGFGMLLRDSPYKGSATFGMVREMAGKSLVNDPNGHRAAFVKQVERAEALSAPKPTKPE
jgi:Ca-activated chloride channel family protein